MVSKSDETLSFSTSPSLHSTPHPSRLLSFLLPEADQCSFGPLACPEAPVSTATPSTQRTNPWTVHLTTLGTLAWLRPIQAHIPRQSRLTWMTAPNQGRIILPELIWTLMRSPRQIVMSLWPPMLCLAPTLLLQVLPKHLLSKECLLSRVSHLLDLRPLLLET